MPMSLRPCRATEPSYQPLPHAYDAGRYNAHQANPVAAGGLLHRALVGAAAGPSLRVLRSRSQRPGPLQPLWQERHRDLQAHAAALAPGQLLGWGLRQLADAVLVGRRSITHTLFPIANMAFHNEMGQNGDFRAERPISSRPGDLTLTPAGIFTNDHVLLDAMWVRPKRSTLGAQAWPVMLFVPPNGMIYEELLVPACHFAQTFRSDVLLFNYRGIGKSLGHLHAIHDAVADTVACIAHARAHSPYVGVLGLSMGGGTGAEALAELQRAQQAADGPVGLFLAVHTFSCWFDVYAGRLGLPAAKQFFRRAQFWRLRDLRPSEALQHTRLAATTLVVEAAHEQVIPATGRLGQTPFAHRHIQIIRDAGARHADLSFLAPTFDPASPLGGRYVRQQLRFWRIGIDEAERRRRQGEAAAGTPGPA